MARVFKEETNVGVSTVVAWGCAAPEDSRPPLSQSNAQFKAPKLFAQVARETVREDVKSFRVQYANGCAAAGDSRAPKKLAAVIDRRYRG